MNYMPWLKHRKPDIESKQNLDIYNALLQSLIKYKPHISEKVPYWVYDRKTKETIYIYHNCIPYIKEGEDVETLSVLDFTPGSTMYPTTITFGEHYPQKIRQLSGKFYYGFIVKQGKSNTKPIILVFDDMFELSNAVNFLRACFSSVTDYSEIVLKQRIDLIHQVRKVTSNKAYAPSDFLPDERVYHHHTKISKTIVKSKRERLMIERRKKELELIAKKEKDKRNGTVCSEEIRD